MRTGWWCVVYGVGLVLWVVGCGYLAARADEYTREDYHSLLAPLGVVWPLMLVCTVIAAAGVGLLNFGARLAKRRAAPGGPHDG